MDSVYGIDVSKWQGDFNFSAAVERGAKFAVIKAGGSYTGGECYTDPTFKTNLGKARAAGLKVGLYWFTKALDTASIAREAKYLCSTIKNERLDLPLYLDMEDERQASRDRKLVNTSMAMAWNASMLEHGFLGGIYTYRNFYDAFMEPALLGDMPRWIAAYTSSKPQIPEPLTMWQFGGNINHLTDPKIDGVDTDQNYMYIDWTARMIKYHLNNLADVPTSIDDVAREVLDGKWGNGSDRRHALEAAGYDYYMVQSAVNKILNEGG